MNQQNNLDRYLEISSEIPLRGSETSDIRPMKVQRSCEICGRSDVRLVQDHDHNTRKERGLICDICNFYYLGVLENFKGQSKTFPLTIDERTETLERFYKPIFWDIHVSEAEVPKIVDRLIKYLDRYNSTFVYETHNIHGDKRIRVVKTSYIRMELKHSTEMRRIYNERRKQS
jgi:hypothetical protein